MRTVPTLKKAPVSNRILFSVQVYTMTRKNSKNSIKYLHSTISYKYKIVLWKFFYAGSQIRAVQIRAMRNRASQGMTNDI